VEAFLKGERLAAHVRSFTAYGHSTLKEHMPPSHQKYLEWTPSRIVTWAKKIGPSTAELIQKIISSRVHPEQAYRFRGSCRKHYPKSARKSAER
jgi:hypothetical protein